MHPAECARSAIAEQLSVLHQRFYSNPHQNLMDSSILYPFFFFPPLSGFNKIPQVILRLVKVLPVKVCHLNRAGGKKIVTFASMSSWCFRVWPR